MYLYNSAYGVIMRFYTKDYPYSERLNDPRSNYDPHLAKATCGFDCGNLIGECQDDCGEFCVETPNGYTGICADCWTRGGYCTAER
jgi:hypothetical protein